MKYPFLCYTIAASCAASLPASAKMAAPLSDNQFAMKAAAGGLTEVQGGEIAEKNAGSPDVKTFGAKMVEDHGAANKKLMKIARKERIQLPDKPMPAQQEKLAKLSKESGAEFDRDYLAAMLAGHKETYALFESEAMHGTDPALKQFAAETAPVVKGHLDMLEHMQPMHHHKKVAMSKGTAAESKSGVAPGANGQGPTKQPSVSTDTTAPAGPSDAAQSKSGVGPGSTGNPPGGSGGAPVAAPSPQ